MKNLLRTSLVICLFLIGLTYTANAGGVNLIVNGSFEETPGWDIVQNMVGWTTEWGLGIEIQHNTTGPAYDGNQYVELDSGIPNGAGEDGNSAMSQEICDISGQKYTLSFAYTPRPGVPALSNVVLVFWNNTLLDCLTGTVKVHTWTVHRYTVTGTGRDKLLFLAGGKGDSLGGYLDAVSLIPSY